MVWGRCGETRQEQVPETPRACAQLTGETLGEKLGMAQAKYVLLADPSSFHPHISSAMVRDEHAHLTVKEIELCYFGLNHTTEERCRTDQSYSF